MTKNLKLSESSITVLQNMHRLLLEALRHREQEIIRYLAFLGPALGGFVWLIQNDSVGVFFFAVGTMGVLLLLLLGAIYSLSLGYNYRYITLELAKLETTLGIEEVMLRGWPRKRKDFLDRYRLKFWKIPWCTPPEIIKIFWRTFCIVILGVTAIGYAHKPVTLVLWLVVPVGTISFLLGLFTPIWYGIKLKRLISKEPKSWKTIKSHHI